MLAGIKKPLEKNKQIIFKIAVFFLMINGAGLALGAKDREQEAILLVRNDPGEGELTYGLLAEDKETHVTEEISLLVGEIRYQEEMLEEKLKEAYAYVDQVMLGENESLDAVMYNLNLVTEIPESGICVSWKCEDYSYVNSQGQVENEGLTEPVITVVTGIFSYEEQVWEREYPLRLVPKVYSKQEEKMNHVKAVMNQIVTEAGFEKSVSIPKEIDGVVIQETKDTYSVPALAFIFSVIVSMLMVMKEKEEMIKKKRERKSRLLREYPLFVNEMTLLIGAGMNVKSSIKKLAGIMGEQGELKKELFVTLHEMEAGISETKAYYNLGRRLGLAPYTKLMALLVQNLTKGNRDLLFVLQEEEIKAFEERKDMARRLGEEAGTKLLMPMILLMGVVMIMLMAPAFLSFL